jgi:hypothetical protein
MIFPIELTEGTVSNAEKVFFEFAKKFFGASQEVDVFHSVRISGKQGARLVEYEVDFIILSAKSIVCVEVKGGKVSLDVANNGWYQNSIQISNPVDQAIKNKHALIARFGREVENIQIFWAVAFPDVQVTSFGELPIGMEPINIIDGNTLAYLDRWFETVEGEAFKTSSVRPFPSRDAAYSKKRVQQVLARSLNFIPATGSKLAYNELKFDQLLTEQKALIDTLSENERLLILGPAGSGKTIIGIHFGLKQVEMGKCVLFLTFNKNLAKNYSYQIEKGYTLPQVGSLQVSTFHSWAKSIIENADSGWWVQNSKSEEFWDLEVPLKLQNCPLESEARYDAIIIDEAQDFEDLWLEPVISALKESGKMIVMLDPNQDIFNRGNQFAKLGFMKIPMKAVIRQTKTLTKQISSILGLDLSYHEKCPEGESISKVDSMEDFKRKFEGDGWPLESLVVLYDPECGLGIFKELKFGRTRIEITRDGRVHRGIIPAVSINVFKGLEAQIVLIPNFQQISSDKLKYVAMSRAKSHLYIHV